ncbi:hypothetical protein Sps_05164 [Shewanella psychrophila]|uniref:Uncharacterized protein n=1 Tax=Shewanella psychrophila TaxID=225848 RepID=A0A1S6HXG8_9GAMM|nr:hypothetical protein [Shewanella psychrophila]AQS40233.1 hypothetical protein Sps_05164 [Shewanella psychrophila]
MNQPKKVKAWLISEESEGHSCIVFHHHGLAARRLGANELDVEFESVESSLKPEFDQYAEEGKVPTKVLLENGWWFECHHCGNKIMSEQIDEDSKRISINEVIVESDTLYWDSIYCDTSCYSAHQAEITAHNDKAIAFKDKVLNTRPDLSFVEFRGEYPQVYCTASFTFDGAQYGGSVACGKNGELDWRVTAADLPAWKEYETKRKGVSA